MIENLTVKICKMFAEKWKQSISPSHYEKIRKFVNESQKSQLEAIEGQLMEDMFVLEHSVDKNYERETFCSWNTTNKIYLYEPFKSTECLYAWVEQGGHLCELPAQFENDTEVIITLIKLFNRAVFSSLPNPSNSLCMRALQIQPNLIVDLKKEFHTPMIRDLVLEHAPTLIGCISPELLTVDHYKEVFWRHPEIFHLIPKDYLTFDIAKYFIDWYKDWRVIDELAENMGALARQCYENKEIMWYMVKNNENLIEHLNCHVSLDLRLRLFDYSILKYMSESCSYSVILSCHKYLPFIVTPVKKTVKKPVKKPIAMIVEAIGELKEHRGSTRTAIYKWIRV